MPLCDDIHILSQYIYVVPVLGYSSNSLDFFAGILSRNKLAATMMALRGARGIGTSCGNEYR